MIVYRLSKGNFKFDLSGKGAELAGGRWNNKGVAVLYTSASRALCAMEILVHVPASLLPTDYHMVSIAVPDDAPSGEILIENLPAQWQSLPHGNKTQQLGDLFVQNRKLLLLKVPSAVVKGDFNYLINPQHPDFEKVKVVETELFEFDSRLFKVG